VEVSDPIRTVVVAGGGITGWSAAAALRRRMPGLVVAVVALEPPADALADKAMSTLPSILEFHRDVGLNEGDTVVRAGSGLRLGISFEEWSNELPPYVHAYGEYGQPFGTTSFHHHWIRASHRGLVATFDSHSPAAAIARAGRFIPPQPDGRSPLAGFEYGLQINPPLYRDLMHAYARHLGASEHPGIIKDVRLRKDDGFIEALILEDGSEIRGDLFVDCTGPRALVRSALDLRFEDWSQWLRCDRILAADGPAVAEPPVLDTVTAVAGGWRWHACSPARSSHGVVYSSAHLSDGKAERALRVASGAEPSMPPVTIRQGRLSQPWFRNCVAVGDAAVAIEPLEWTNLHLAHSAIDRIIAMMPDRDCAEVELWDYNRQSAAEADRVRDFVILHYATANRPGDPFWREAAAAEPPASLAHSLNLFRERGRLPFYEEETFSRDSWLAVLFGQGMIPRRVDPLIDAMPAERAEEVMQRMRSTIESMVSSLPTQSDYLRSLARQIAQ
jgi:tryptophan halogenase